MHALYLQYFSSHTMTYFRNRISQVKYNRYENWLKVYQNIVLFQKVPFVYKQRQICINLMNV